MASTDAELIHAIQSGQASAFDTLYHRYRDWVVTLALRFCGNQDDALDVLQETFAYFFRKLPGFELRSQFKTFLYPAVKHLALTRKRRMHAGLEGVEPAVVPAAAHSEDLLAGLPDDQREVVWMRFVDEMDLKEIAQALEIPLGTVKSRLHVALKFLKSHKTF